MSQEKDWIHCCACESEWLDDIAEYDEYEPCPYCGCRGRITDVSHSECPNCAMGRMAALAHLTTLVDTARLEDKHYSKALEVVKDILLTPKCPLTTRPCIHIYMFGGIAEYDAKPNCVDVHIEYE